MSQFEPLTHLETRVLDAVMAHRDRHGESPTLAELARTLRLRSRGTVHRYVQSLVRKQRLVRAGGGWRNLRPVSQAAPSTVAPPGPAEGHGLRLVASNPPEAIERATAGNVVDFRHVVAEPVDGAPGIPLLGRIAAGRPIEAIEDAESLDLGAFFVGPDRYALRVTGDSMVDVGILDGDTVILRKQETARPGEVVVALIDGQEATLKRLGRVENGMVELIPENSAMRPMHYAAGRVSIQGVLVGQLRSYAVSR